MGAVAVPVIGGRIESITIGGVSYEVKGSELRDAIRWRPGRVMVGPSAWADWLPEIEQCVVPFCASDTRKPVDVYLREASAFLLVDGLMRVAGVVPAWRREE